MIDDLGHASFAYVKQNELESGITRIHLGDMSCFLGWDDFIEKNAEGVISHESTHIAIHKMTQCLFDTMCFDNIDGAWRDGPYVYSRPFE